MSDEESSTCRVIVIDREHTGTCSFHGCRAARVMSCIACKKDFCFHHLSGGGFTRTHCSPCAIKIEQTKQERYHGFIDVRKMVSKFPGTKEEAVNTWFEELREYVNSEDFD